MDQDILTRLQTGTTLEAALSVFDSLPAVALDMMIGSWRGSGVPTGHRLDGMLEIFGWHGKRFDGIDEVHPLVFATSGGRLFSVNPALIPMGLVIHHASMIKRPALAAVLKSCSGLMRTKRPRARLRMTEFRGVTTATMIYDALPINDMFRMIDRNTVLGVMDLRLTTEPFVFALRREG